MSYLNKCFTCEHSKDEDSDAEVWKGRRSSLLQCCIALEMEGDCLLRIGKAVRSSLLQCCIALEVEGDCLLMIRLKPFRLRTHSEEWSMGMWLDCPATIADLGFMSWA